ncbi:MAG TPA: TolC family outer membrane protein [Woeseiaceae bacterium]|nr:TolC family outer membrane protein [Woeseiaceae bacterium]
MKKTPVLRRLMLTLAALTASAGAEAASLLEVYQQALQSDPLIHEAEARRLAAMEAKPQARGFLLPQVNGTGSYTDGTQDGSRLATDPDTGVFASLPFQTNFTTKEWSLGLRQTIFRWDQFIGMKQADKTVARADVVYEAAQQDLMVRVVQRYFDVLGAEDRLTSIHADRQAISRQLDQAKQRFEVGLIAITDVQESQAAYDQAVASEIAAQRELATARELLREVTGERVRELAAPAEDFPLPSPNPTEIEAWVDLAMEQNLDLLASRFDERIARDEIAFRRSGHYPTIDLVANRGSTDTEADFSSAGSPFFPADQLQNTDFIGVEVTVPLFSGGRTSSLVREAVYLHRAQMEQLQRISRETERATRDAYLGVLSEISRVNALEQAVASSRTALEATQAGFDVGTRTIVDVLNSQRALYQAITNYYQSRYDYVTNVLQLKRAAGTLKVQDLERIDRSLKERKPPEQAIAEDEAKAAEKQKEP